jgi:hypothetical protein
LEETDTVALKFGLKNGYKIPEELFLLWVLGILASRD